MSDVSLSEVCVGKKARKSTIIKVKLDTLTRNNRPLAITDAQEFLEATLAAEKLSLAALEHRSRLMTKVSALMKDYDAHQAEMYIDMSPTLKLTFKAFESSASENSSLKDSRT